MACDGQLIYLASEGVRERSSNLVASLQAKETQTVANADVVIADDITGTWYLEVPANKAVAVVKDTWLHACAAARVKVPYTDFRFRGLEGCKVCITGSADHVRRDQLAQLIVELGAEFSAELRKDCTHLVALSTAHPKYKYAVQWSIATVSGSWLMACKQRQLRVDERLYPVQDPSQVATHSTGSASHQQQHTATHRQNPSSGPQPTTSTSTITAAAGIAPGVPLPRHQSLSSRPHLIAPSPPVSTELPSTATPPTAATLINHLISTAVQDPLKHDWLFLDCVRFHTLGLSTDETRVVAQLAACGGALRCMALDHEVTHILVGSQAGQAELAQAKEHVLARAGQVVVVWVQWLQECVAQRKCLEPMEPGLMVPLDKVVTRATTLMGPDTSSTLAPASSLPAPANPALPHLQPASTTIDFGDLTLMDSRSRGGFVDVGAGSMGGAAAWQEVALSAEVGKALSDLWFTLAAVPHDKELAQLVRSNGGHVFTADSLRKVKDTGRAFALCPQGMNPQTVQDLEKAAADFRAVTHRVTGVWLKECLKSRVLLDPSHTAYPWYKPFMFDVPLPCLAQSMFCVAGFKGPQRKFVDGLLRAVGAPIYENGCHPSCTHVVVPDTSSQKYKYGAQHGMTVVNDQWVLHLSKTGRLPDAFEGRFRPTNETTQEREFVRKQVGMRAQQGQQWQHQPGQQSRGLNSQAALSEAEGRTGSLGANTALVATQFGPTQQQAGTEQVSANAGDGVIGPATRKSVSYTAATGFRLTGLGAQADAAAADGKVIDGKPVSHRSLHPSGIPAGPQVVTAQEVVQAPTGPSPLQPQGPALPAPGGGGVWRQPSESAGGLVPEASAPSHTRTTPAQGIPVQNVQGTGNEPGMQPRKQQRQQTGNEQPPQKSAPSSISVVKSSNALSTNNRPVADGEPAPGTDASVSVQPVDQPALTAVADLVGSAGDEELADVHNSIQALLQTHARSGGSTGPGDVSSGRGGPSSHGPAATAPSGMDTAQGPDDAPKAGGRSVPVRGAKRGSASLDGMTSDSSGMKAPRPRRSNRLGPTTMMEEMSQQVEYDLGQRPDERLLRSRGGADGAGGGGAGGDEQPKATKQEFLTRILRNRA